MKVSEFAKKYPGTDKFTTPGQPTWHCYERFYDVEFPKYKDKDITLLEIGVAGGDSLRLWREYFPNAIIVGVDINPIIKISNVSIIQYDAYGFTLRSPNGVDIFIDDGPHTIESQKRAIQSYLPHMNPGGLFVIEDIIEESYIQELLDLIPPDYHVEVHDYVPETQVYADRLLAVKVPPLLLGDK